jgi:hypothetical protein
MLARPARGQATSRPGEAGEPGTAMLTLSHLPPVITGHQRAVYQHPHDAALIVKTMRPESVAHRWDAPGRWYKRLPRVRHYVSYLREIKEYIAAHTCPDPDPPIARIVGLVETDVGLGLVCEKVRAPNGEMAPTLHQCWVENGGEPPWARPALEVFLESLLRHNVIVGDLNAANLVFGSDSRGGPRLLMVDGFGEKGAIPLSSMSRVFNRHFIRRRYRRMLRDLSTPVEGWTGPRTEP